MPVLCGGWSGCGSRTERRFNTQISNHTNSNKAIKHTYERSIIHPTILNKNPTTKSPYNQAHNHVYRQAHNQANSQAYNQANSQAYKQAYKQAHKQAYRQGHNGPEDGQQRTTSSWAEWCSQPTDTERCRRQWEWRRDGWLWSCLGG